MAARFPPDRQADLATFVSQFSAKITLAPASYGLVAGQCSAFAALQASFCDFYEQSQDKNTRTPRVLEQKKQAQKAMLANLRQLVRIIEACPTVTNDQRVDLGLPVRDVTPSPAPVPSVAPKVDVLSVVGRRVKVRIHDSDPQSRMSKPTGVAGASLFSYVGTTPPGDVSEWKFEGNVMRTIVTVEFPLSVPAFSQVYFTAFWFNRRGNSGPACMPVSTNVGQNVPVAA